MTTYLASGSCESLSFTIWDVAQGNTKVEVFHYMSVLVTYIKILLTLPRLFSTFLGSA